MNRHLYYANPQMLDLSKFREVAQKHAAGDYRTEPQTCTIHFHALGLGCKGYKHEIYSQTEEGNVEVTEAVAEG